MVAHQLEQIPCQKVSRDRRAGNRRGGIVWLWVGRVRSSVRCRFGLSRFDTGVSRQPRTFREGPCNQIV